MFRTPAHATAQIRMYERLRRQGRAGDREHDHERKFFFWRLRGLFEIGQPEGLVDELR